MFGCSESGTNRLFITFNSWYRSYFRIAAASEDSEADLEAEAARKRHCSQGLHQGTALKAPHARTRGGPLSRHGLWLFLAILKQTFTAAVALDDLL